MSSTIEIKPDILQFKSPLTVQSTELAYITNNSSEPIAFKVKTTAPKFYCVRPNASIVQPGQTVEIQIILLGLTSEPTDPNFKCKDKFLVITLPAPYKLPENKTVAEVWPELEAEFKSQAVSKKIKVRFNINPNATSDVPATSTTHKDQLTSTTGNTTTATATAPQGGFNSTLLVIIALIVVLLAWFLL